MSRARTDVDAFDLTTAAAITGSGIAAYLSLRAFAIACGAPVVVSVLGAQIAMVLAIVVGGRGVSLPARLGLRPAAARFFFAVVLVGASVWVVDEWVTLKLAETFGPPPQGMVPNLGLAPGLIIIGVFAPVCEELLFRGVLARSLETRFRRPAAIAISALAFALAHESPYRLFAPLLIGAIAAYVTLRSRSVVPAIVLHALNNTILVLHSHVVSGTFTRWTLAHLDALIAPAVALVLAGVAISRVGEG